MRNYILNHIFVKRESSKPDETTISMSLTFNIHEPFWHNFDLSVVIPFYKKMKEFERVLRRLSLYWDNIAMEI